MSRRYAWVIPIVTVILLALGFAAAVAGHDRTAIWLASTFAITIAAFAIVGGLISSRHPANAIGWLMSTIALMFALVVAASAGARWGLQTEHLPQGLWEWVAIGATAGSWPSALSAPSSRFACRTGSSRLIDGGGSRVSRS